MTEQTPTDVAQYRIHLTRAQACPYVPGRRERKAFLPLDTSEDPQALYDRLTQAGFRRSQGVAYRPACAACAACIPVRAPAARFSFSRRWRRILNRNADLTAAVRPAVATAEQYALLSRYLEARHGDGGMAGMSAMDYAEMVEESPVATALVEYREAGGALVAVALIDTLQSGTSMVYSFFEPATPKRSLGSFMILDQVARAQIAGLAYVYLGYWVRGSDKMDYKAEFRPLEYLWGGCWRPFEGAGPRLGSRHVSA